MSIENVPTTSVDQTTHTTQTDQPQTPQQQTGDLLAELQTIVQQHMELRQQWKQRAQAEIERRSQLIDGLNVTISEHREAMARLQREIAAGSPQTSTVPAKTKPARGTTKESELAVMALEALREKRERAGQQAPANMVDGYTEDQERRYIVRHSHMSRGEIETAIGQPLPKGNLATLIHIQTGQKISTTGNGPNMRYYV